MIITISGGPGTGKSTVAKLLAEKLKYKFYSMGGVMRQLAKKHKMTLEDFTEYNKTHPASDKEVDAFQKKLGKNKDNFVIEGRLSWHFIPKALKILLTVDKKEAARRILKDIKENKRKSEKKAGSITEVIKKMKKRDKVDRARYKKLYGIVYDSKKNFDLVINTTKLTPKEIVERINISVLTQ